MLQPRSRVALKFRPRKRNPPSCHERACPLCRVPASWSRPLPPAPSGGTAPRGRHAGLPRGESGTSAWSTRSRARRCRRGPRQGSSPKAETRASGARVRGPSDRQPFRVIVVPRTRARPRPPWAAGRHASALQARSWPADLRSSIGSLCGLLGRNRVVPPTSSLVQAKAWSPER